MIKTREICACNGHLDLEGYMMSGQKRRIDSSLSIVLCSSKTTAGTGHTLRRATKCIFVRVGPGEDSIHYSIPFHLIECGPFPHLEVCPEKDIHYAPIDAGMRYRKSLRIP